MFHSKLLCLSIAWGMVSMLSAARSHRVSRQYPSQMKAVANLTAIAVRESKAHTQEAYAILSTRDVRDALNRTCPQWSHLSSKDLLQRILDEFAVSEMLHTFPSVVQGNEEGDTGLATVTNNSYFYNIWQVDFLKLPRGERLPKQPLNYVEQVLFGLPPFTKSAPEPYDDDPLTLKAASERLVYTALNHAKVPGPNNGFGDVSMIIKRKAVANMTVVSPVDTGYWYFQCVDEYSTEREDCSKWNGTLGTLDALTHLLVTKHWMAHGNESYEETGHIYPMVDCNPSNNHQVRIHGWPYPYPYFEADVLGNVLYPDAVQGVIMSFKSLFGTDLGKRAQEWCKKHKWPLFWSFNASKEGTDLHLNGNGRVMDAVVLPHSLVAHNYTAHPNDTEAFKRVLKDVTTFRYYDERISAEQWDEWWGNISVSAVSNTSYSSLSVQPLSAHQCARPNDCVAVTQGNLTCLCEPA